MSVTTSTRPYNHHRPFFIDEYSFKYLIKIKNIRQNLILKYRISWCKFCLLSTNPGNTIAIYIIIFMTLPEISREKKFQ